MALLTSPTPDRRWLVCRNQETVDIESHSLVQIVGAATVSGRVAVEVELARRAALFSRPLAAVGPARIRPGGLGHCTMQWPAWVRTVGAAQAGDFVGPYDSHIGRIGPLGEGFLLHSDAAADPWRALASFGPQYFRSRKIRFQLNFNTLRETEMFEATTAAVERWDGYKPPMHEQVVVWNLPLGENYMFSGGENHVGLAVHDPETDRYWVFNMECP